MKCIYKNFFLGFQPFEIKICFFLINNLLFQFKQFTINQDRCAMKVGTDGVLLGAWAPIDHRPFSVLDIGAGTGLIALMLAQRSQAEQIEAIEIDPDAFEQTVENFENTPWNDRLFCFHASLDDFMEDLQDEEYDLIVSNPPKLPGFKDRPKAKSNAVFWHFLELHFRWKLTP